MRGRLEAALAQLSSAGTPPDAAVLLATFQLSGAQPLDLLGELLGTGAGAEGPPSYAGNAVNLSLALTRVTAGAVLLSCAAESSIQPGDLSAVTRRFAVELCLPLLLAREARGHSRAVATALATSVAVTDAWHLGAQLLHECLASLVAEGAHQGGLQTLPLTLLAAESQPLRDTESTDVDGQQLRLFSQETACVVASAVLEELGRDEEPRTAASALARSSMGMLSCALGALSHEATPASVDAALVRDVIPAALDLCLATGHGDAAAAALRDTATSLLANTRLQCHRAGMALLARFADVCVPPMPARGLDDEGPFWAALRFCLWHPDDTRLRKQALHVLRCALGPERCAAGGWANWLLVADGIEDYSVHLASPAFQRLRLLHPAAGSSCGGPGDSEVPLQWVGVLWCKAVTHENPQFRRQALDALADSDWGGQYGRVLPESAICGPLLGAVNDPTNHAGDDPLVAAAGVAAAAAACVRSAGRLRTERGDAARRLLTAIVELRSPTRQGLAAMLHVARAACQACASDADAELEPVAQGDLTLELLRRLAILGCLQWGSMYRANAAQLLLDAASAIMPPRGASVAAVGRFLDALTRTGGLTGASCAHLRAGAAQWLAAGGPEHGALFAQALDAHAATFLKGETSGGDHPADPAAHITAEELADWASSARHITMLWSLLPDAACKLALASRLQADASSVYARAHAPQGWMLRVLLLLDSMARAADASDDVMHGVAVSCVAEVAALAGAALCRGLLAPVSPDAPLLLTGVHHGAAGLAVDRCGTSPTGGPPSVLAPSRVAAGHVACAALSALSACNRWRHPADAARDDEAAAAAWRQCDADLWRMLSYFALSAPQSDGDGNKAAAEMHDTAVACVALAVEALVPADAGAQSARPAPPEDVPHTADDVASRLFAYVTHIAADDGQPTRRTAGGMPGFLGATEASQRGGVATCAGARWRAVSSVLRLPGACSPVTHTHSLALGGAIAACVDVARGDSADVFRAVHTLLPVLLASAHADGGHFIQAAAEAAAKAAGDDTLIDIHRYACDDDASSPLDEQLLTEHLAPLACALCRCIWAGLSDTPNRPVIVIAECLAAALHPVLFSVASLHAPKAGPLRWFVRSLLTVSEQSGRLMRLAAAALWALWLQFPQLVTAAQYDAEMARINLFSVADHDADYAEDLIDPGAAAALRAVPGGTDAASFGSFAGEALAVRVTGVCAAHQLACRGSVGGEADARDAARALLRRLLHGVLHDRELSMETYRKNSVTHRRKVRAWQLLAALAPTLPFEGEDLAGSDGLLLLLEQCFLSTLDKLNLPSVKQYEEAFFTAVLLRAPSLVHSHVVPALDVTQSTSRPYTLASLVLIAHAYLRHEPDLGKQRRALPAIFAAVTPWTCTHNHSLRTFSQTVMFELFDAFPVGHPAWSDCDGAADAFIGTAGGVLASMRSFFVLNDDCVKTRLATGRVGSLHPSVACTPEVIFGRGADCPFQVGPKFEGAPTPMVERIAAFLDSLRVDTRMGRIAAEGTFLLQGHKQASAAPLPVVARGAAQQPSLQKKIEPLSAALDLLLGSTDDPLDGGRLGRGAAMQRQDLVLCASLVDKPTNLGGLARTAEVFLLNRLVIHDLSVVQNPVFKGMAVTAERHVPIAAVPGGALPAFLAAKRAEGYSLVGLEQTTGSVPLPDYAFPQRCVLLLGAEGLGIPAELLPLLDACVEIPQPGKAVRSLNVHVSAALAVYCYTCQWHTDG